MLTYSLQELSCTSAKECESNSAESKLLGAERCCERIGVLDVDPCFAWNCQVVAGVGVVRDIGHLYHDMHTYLAGEPISNLKNPC